VHRTQNCLQAVHTGQTDVVRSLVITFWANPIYNMLKLML